MTRLLVHVEGQTEESFVNSSLADHLGAHGYKSTSARILGNARQRAQRGGIKGWPEAKSDIARQLRHDRECVVSTMVDYYALPSTGPKAWPGRAAAGGLPMAERAPSVEAALSADLVAAMGANFDPQRFVPFVVMHEFEGLLFSDCTAFARAIGRQALAGDLQFIRDQFGTPEEINDSPITAPSKRILSLFPGYQKPLMGNVAALEIGLPAIRLACPHFSAWLTALEALV